MLHLSRSRQIQQKTKAESREIGLHEHHFQ